MTQKAPPAIPDFDEYAPGWTAERAEIARQRIYKVKPWEKSTGPRTRAGKMRSRLNGYKSGRYSKIDKAFSLLLGL